MLYEVITEIEAEGKLHEVGGVGADEAEEERPEKEARDRQHREGLHAPVDEERRITSYNVCYTKLLRSSYGTIVKHMSVFRLHESCCSSH